MPLQNRVTPFGEIVALPARGTLMGSRGCLHDVERKVVKSAARVAWVTCRLQWKDIHRTIMAPGKYTELFFLDEATALAAGHRPCGDCRAERLVEFERAWAAGVEGRPGGVAVVQNIDPVMKLDRTERKKILALAQARKIDVILVTELTRWGRSMLDLFHTLQDPQVWDVSFVAQTGLQLDLRGAQGKIIASLMAALAKFERDLLRERVRSGIAAAGKRGPCSAAGPFSRSRRTGIRRGSCSWSASVSPAGRSVTGSASARTPCSTSSSVIAHRHAGRPDVVRTCS